MRPNKIAVVGPGTVGMPMAALLASAAATDGSPPPRVVVVQRPSAASGWKVKAINAGRSPLGGHEPLLQSLIAESVARLAVSGTNVGPSITGLFRVLERERVEKRITRFLAA